MAHSPGAAQGTATPPVFAERPSSRIVPDAGPLAAAPLAAAALLLWLGAAAAALAAAGLALFVVFFFRNPRRVPPGDDRSVVSPADGLVLEAGEIELPGGAKGRRVGIFLSIFDVHVNRSPLAGRVLAVERTAGRYRAAFAGRAPSENARCTLTLETAGGARVQVVQIAGLVARRIVCHPRPGEWLARGVRYGLIRFGSRTDVILPRAAELRVRSGQRVRGGRDVIAVLPSALATADLSAPATAEPAAPAEPASARGTRS